MAFGFGKDKKKEFGLNEDIDLDEENIDLPPLPSLPEDEEEELPGEELEAPIFEPVKREPMLRAPGVMEKPKPVASTIPLKRAPVFIKIDKYKELMQTVQAMQDKIVELQSTLDSISSIKSKEREIIEGLGSLVTEAKGKVTEVSSKLLRPDV